MGLERVAYLLQGVDNLYEIDEVFPVLDRAAALAGKQYGSSKNPNDVDDVRLRVVADHVRSAMMLISDGVTPGNEARGYVLRRLLRRTVRSMRLLGYEDPVLPELLPISRDAMAPSYPELASGFGRISQLAYAEEETFRGTLRAGTTILDTAVRETKTAGGSKLSGERAFQLHDTYGFPIDLTLEMAAEQGLSVDEEGFRRLMREQRERAQADSKAKKSGHADLAAYRSIVDSGGTTTFTGLRRGRHRRQGRRGPRQRCVACRPPARGTRSSSSSTAPRSTPRAAASSPTRARSGWATAPSSTVDDVQTPMPGVIVHRGRVTSGEVAVGDEAHSTVDVERRRSISRAHTATHLVHRPSATRWGRPPRRPARRTRPAASASTSRRAAPCRRACCVTSSRRSTRCWPPTSTCAPRS